MESRNIRAVTLDDKNLRKTTQLTLAKIKLLGGNDDGRGLIITAPYEAKPDEAVPVLQGFLDDRMSTIIKGLHDARSR